MVVAPANKGITMNADTLATHTSRVEACQAAGHVPEKVSELGWTRRVCADCRSDWPCAEFAQAAAWRG